MGAVQLKERPAARTSTPAKKLVSRPTSSRRRKPITKRRKAVNHAKVAARRHLETTLTQGLVVFVFTWVCVSIVGYTMMLSARREAKVAQGRANSAHEESRRVRTEIDELNSPRELERAAAGLRLYPGGVNVAAALPSDPTVATPKKKAAKKSPVAVRAPKAPVIAMKNAGEPNVQVR